MIDNSQVKNQSALAKKLGNPLKSKIITERMLRQFVNESFREQKKLLYILKTLFPL